MSNIAELDASEMARRCTAAAAQRLRELPSLPIIRGPGISAEASLSAQQLEDLRRVQSAILDGGPEAHRLLGERAEAMQKVEDAARVAISKVTQYLGDGVASAKRTDVQLQLQCEEVACQIATGKALLEDAEESMAFADEKLRAAADEQVSSMLQRLDDRIALARSVFKRLDEEVRQGHLRVTARVCGEILKCHGTLPTSTPIWLTCADFVKLLQSLKSIHVDEDRTPPSLSRCLSTLLLTELFERLTLGDRGLNVERMLALLVTRQFIVRSGKSTTITEQRLTEPAPFNVLRSLAGGCTLMALSLPERNSNGVQRMLCDADDCIGWVAMTTADHHALVIPDADKLKGLLPSTAPAIAET